jgi:two-component system cell cycle response regulator
MTTGMRAEGPRVRVFKERSTDIASILEIVSEEQASVQALVRQTDLGLRVQVVHAEFEDTPLRGRLRIVEFDGSPIGRGRAEVIRLVVEHVLRERRDLATEGRDCGARDPREPSTKRIFVDPLRVLVVDDDAASRALMDVVVASLGHLVTSARDGAEAWMKLQSQPVDMILSDWMMPGMSGTELCWLVRSRDPASYTYFVLMTALGDKAHFLEGMRAGADDYLTKPIDRDELEARLLSAARVVRFQGTLAQRNAVLARESAISFEEARVDAFTQMGNRLRLAEDLAALQSRATRYGHRHCAALCDIDLFKSYNDHYGHMAGDEALRRVATTIRSALRQADTLYRYGGEEFLAILPEQTIAEAGRAMDRVRKTVEGLDILHPASRLGVVTISAGVAELLDPMGSSDDWLGAADAALYRAKENGRNRVELEARPSLGPPTRGPSFDQRRVSPA